MGDDVELSTYVKKVVVHGKSTKVCGDSVSICFIHKSIKAWKWNCTDQNFPCYKAKD